MKRVESTNLKNVSYNTRSRVLTIVFHGGAKYRYSHVEPEVFSSLVEAPSIGAYFNSTIRKNPAYPVVRVN